ncbi:MAG: histidine kinase, partial [Alphaproteobacteria bacterium]
MADDKNRVIQSSALKRALRAVSGWFAPLGRTLEALYPFKSLTQLIIFLNLFGFAILVSGALYFNQFRAGLIDTKVQSLLVQGEIIASAIAVTAGSDRTADPKAAGNVLELESGQSGALDPDAGLGSLEFLVNPERTAPDFSKLIQPTGTRARIYDQDGWLVLDSDTIFTRGQVRKFELPPPDKIPSDPLMTLWQKLSNWIWRPNLPLYKDLGSQNGKAYPEVATALTGTAVPIVRVNAKGELVVSVAVPIRKVRAVLGVLLLSTRGGEIDSIVAAERWVL